MKTIFYILTFILFALLNENSVYAQPKEREYWPTSGWKFSSPEKHGLDSAKLAIAVEFIENRLPDAYSLLVIKNGYLVFEKYFRKGNPQRLAAIHSVTKSVMSALIGIAIDKGDLNNVDQKIVGFFPEFITGESDPRKKQIGLKHLLTMSAGIKWEDWNPILGAWYYSVDWAQSALLQPQEYSPGDKFNYNSSLSHLLSIILEKSTKTSTLEFADQNFFKPLGIKERSWKKGPQEYYIGGFGLSLSARDLAKIGFLYLHNGFWNGQSIVPEHWVKESTQQWMYAFNRYGPTGYGYQWWIKQVDGCFSYRAWGGRGQFIVVVPELDMVIVVTSETALPHPPTGIHYSPLFDLVANSVNRERPPKKPIIAVELPADVKAFIADLNQAIFDKDMASIGNFISDGFLNDGTNKQRTLKVLKGTASYLSEAKFIITKFEPEGDIAKIEGMIKDKYFEAPFMTGHMLIKENGQWKLYGNQIPK